MTVMQAGIHAGPTTSTAGAVSPGAFKQTPSSYANRVSDWWSQQSWVRGIPLATGDPSFDAIPGIIRANPAIVNASVPTWVTLAYDYAPLEDLGLMFRPAASMIPGNCFNSSACSSTMTGVIGTFNPTPTILSAGTRLQLALCEAQALVAAGAARLS